MSHYDGDADGIPAKDDNCPEVANVGQEDWNGDSVGDACAVDACITADNVAALLAGKETFAAAGGMGNKPEDEAVFECMPMCSDGAATCTMAECIAEETGLSPECGGCYAAKFACQQVSCSDICVAGADWSQCEACVEEKPRMRSRDVPDWASEGFQWMPRKHRRILQWKLLARVVV